MENNSSHQIKPKAIPPPSGYSESDRIATEADKSEARRRAFAKYDWIPEELWWVIWIVVGLLLRALLVTVFPWFVGLIFGFGIPIFGWIAFINFRSNSNLEKVITERLQKSAEFLQVQYLAAVDSEEKATSVLVLKVETIYSDQKANVATLHDLLQQTEASLVRARQLFSEHAYTPFWDSIENAVESLKHFNRRVSLINHSAKDYYAQLEGREHTFPTFPVKNGDLPNPDDLIKDLTERIAEAQRDFQFASIFEQRRTTSAIVTGFRNMQEAITSLRNDIVRSLSTLQSSIEWGLGNLSSNIREGFDELAESQQQSTAELRETLDEHAKETAKHQKFAEAALDNIQNRRKPSLSETKTPFRSK